MEDSAPTRVSASNGYLQSQRVVACVTNTVSEHRAADDIQGGICNLLNLCYFFCFYDMHNTNSAFSAILYQNTNKTVTLLDIPKSISLAQSTPEHPANDQQIYSSQPLQAPYPSTEPRSQRAKANVLRSKAPSDTNELGFSETCLRQALVEIAENGEGRWCLERKISPFAVERQSDVRNFKVHPSLSLLQLR